MKNNNEKIENDFPASKNLVVIFYVLLIFTSFVPLLPLILPIALWVTKKNDSFAVFHAKYQLKIILMILLAYIISGSTLLSMGTMMFFSFKQFGILLGIILLVVGLLKAFNEEAF